LFLSAYTVSTSFLNQIGRKITINNPIVPVMGSIGINMKIIRTRAHLILATMETAIIFPFLACFFEMLKELHNIALFPSITGIKKLVK